MVNRAWHRGESGTRVGGGQVYGDCRGLEDGEAVRQHQRGHLVRTCQDSIRFDISRFTADHDEIVRGPDFLEQHPQDVGPSAGPPVELVLSIVHADHLLSRTPNLYGSGSLRSSDEFQIALLCPQAAGLRVSWRSGLSGTQQAREAIP